MSTNYYFASVESEKIGAEIFKKIKDWNRYISTSGMLSIWAKLYKEYYKAGVHYGRIQRSGKAKEYRNLYINDFRSLIQHLVTLITDTKIFPEPRAINSDYKSQAQTLIAKTVLEYYNREKKIDSRLFECAEMAIAMCEGYIGLEWDAKAGEVYEELSEEGETTYKGDLNSFLILPPDKIRDIGLQSANDGDWTIIKRFDNKYKLAAKFPEKAEEIKKLTNPKESAMDDKDAIFFTTFDRDRISVGSDIIPYYIFYHAKNAAIPDGRFVIAITSDIVVIDKPLPYVEIPVYGMFPGLLHGTPFGYGPAMDMLPIQEALDVAMSSVMTNVNAFGVQNITAPDSSSISVSELTGGMKWVKYQEGTAKPEPLVFLDAGLLSSLERFVTMLTQKQQDVIAINAAARGNPAPGLTAGVSIALLQSTAISYAKPLVRSYNNCAEDVLTGIVRILKEYAVAPRNAYIAGHSQASYVVEFRNTDLSKIDRVQVNQGNPIMGTNSGKWNLAEMLVKYGLIKNPDEVVTVITTGQVEGILENPTKERLLIQYENELLMKGIKPVVMASDDHRAHLNSHRGVTANPEIRNSEEGALVVEANTAHMQEHFEMLKTLDPDFLMVFGQQPIFPPPNQSPPNEPTPGTPQGTPGNAPDKGVEIPTEEDGSTAGPIESIGNPEDYGRSLRDVSNPVTGEVLYDN